MASFYQCDAAQSVLRSLAESQRAVGHVLSSPVKERGVTACSLVWQRFVLLTVCWCTRLVARLLQQCGFHFFTVKHKPYVLRGWHTLVIGVSIISDTRDG